MKRVLTTTLLVLAATAVALFAARLPGWRHRHAGSIGHTHSHPGHTHTHSHGLIAAQIDFSVYQALGTRAAGETVGEF